MWPRTRTYAPYAILSAAFLVFLVYAFPGYGTSDTLVQLGQARSHVYSDGHPPMMAALWGLVEHIVKGPLGMLLLQSVTLLIGLVLILRHHFTFLVAAILASAIFLFPAVVTPMAVIWKDCQMAGYMMLGIALMLERRRELRWLGLGFITLAVAMRHNAPAAALPAIALLWPSAAKHWALRIALAVGLWIASTCVVLVVEHELVTVHDYAWSFSLGPGDIEGILANTRTEYSDVELHELLVGTPLQVQTGIQAHAKTIYTPTVWWWVMNGDDRLFDWPASEATRDAFGDAWTRFVKREPGAYLHHRTRVFRALLGFPMIYNPVLFGAVSHSKILVDPETASESTWGPQHALQSVADWVPRHLPVYQPWMYLLLALIFVPLAWRTHHALALLLSGILYELTYLPFAPSSEYRYSHWMIVCTIVATIILIRQRVAATSTRRSD